MAGTKCPVDPYIHAEEVLKRQDGEESKSREKKALELHQAFERTLDAMKRNHAMIFSGKASIQELEVLLRENAQLRKEADELSKQSNAIIDQGQKEKKELMAAYCLLQVYGDDEEYDKYNK